MIHDTFLTDTMYTTLYVKGFGKITEAEIELAPFTVFIGDNNSGKSYLLNLIWGLQGKSRIPSRFFSLSENKGIEKTQAYKDIHSKVASIIPFPVTQEENISLNFTPQDIDAIMVLINTMLYNNKELILKDLFNSSIVGVDEIYLCIPSSTHMDISYSVKKIMSLTQGTYYSSIGWMDQLFTGTIRENENSIESFIQTLVHCVLFILFPSSKIFKDGRSTQASFLPTGRTGLLPLRMELAKQGIAEKFQLQNNNSALSPALLLHSTIFFLQSFFSLDAAHENGSVKEIIDYMENEIIHGTLTMHPETREFFYTPFETKIKLPMHMSSAVVTELAPLLLYLKYSPLSQILFMEEPEISLHPELQLEITRVLIKLINKFDQQIFISTHSDTIIQHINNMIKLSNNPDERQKEVLVEFGDNYDESDIIHQEKIRMYQFDVENATQKTTIRTLASSKYGFSAPTFSTFIHTMSDRIDALLERL